MNTEHWYIIPGEQGDKGDPGQPGSDGFKGTKGEDATQEACSGDKVSSDKYS